MKLSNKAIIEFKEAYKKVKKVQLDDSEAQDLGLYLLTFFTLIYKPIPKKDQVLTKVSPMYEL